MTSLRIRGLALVALATPLAFAQNQDALRSKIKGNDISGAYRAFINSNRGRSSGSREISFRASLLERMGHYHLAIAERASLARRVNELANDSKLGNLALYLDYYAPLMRLPRSGKTAVAFGAAYSVGFLKDGQVLEAVRSMPSQNALMSLSKSAPTYRGWVNLAGAYLALGRYSESMYLLGSEYAVAPNFDLGLVRLQRARLLFDARKYTEALDELIYLPRSSTSWYQGAMVGAWSAYYLRDYNLALGQLMNVHSPYLSGKYNPESYLLESAVLYRLCYYESAQRSVNKLKEKYASLPGALRRFQSMARQPVQLMNAVVRYARGEASPERGISAKDWGLIMDALSTEQLVADTDRALTLLARERAFINKELVSGADGGLRQAYSRALNDARQYYYNRVARFATKLVAKMERDTLEALEGSLAVEVEVNTRIRDRLLSGKTPQRKEVDFEREVKKGFEFWPFDGEFWRDETGNYAFATTDVCEASK
jgi:hypothetical protein